MSVFFQTTINQLGRKFNRNRHVHIERKQKFVISQFKVDKEINMNLFLFPAADLAH